MEWLAENLTRAFPFDDSVTDPALAALFADALISSPAPGPYTLTAFNPQALTNGSCTIMSGATTVLSVTTMTGVTMGAYTVISAVDNAHSSTCRFIVSTAALQSYASLTAPALFVPDVCNVQTDLVTTLNGLQGDIDISFDKYVSLTPSGQSIEVSAEEPADRVTCPDVPEVLTVNGIAPDNNGSLAVDLDGCMRLIPNPANPNQLILADFCTPCVDTTDVTTINTWLTYQAQYFYQMASIYQNQFNRYQVMVAALNEQQAVLAARASLSIAGDSSTSTGGLVPDILIDISGRCFNRPYFPQLVLGITNSSAFSISISLVVTVGGTALASQLDPVAGSGFLQRFLENGAVVSPITPFPGTLVIPMAPRETISLGSELHLNSVTPTGPQAGQWLVTATVTFVSGPSSLPAPRTFSKSFPIQLVLAPFTAPPATTT